MRVFGTVDPTVRETAEAKAEAVAALARYDLDTMPDDAAAEVEPDDGWRPISEAPRDGTLYDLWSAFHCRVCDCHYRDGKHLNCRETFFYLDATHFRIPSAPKESK